MLATAGICLPAVSRAETGTKQKLVYLVIDTSSSMMDDAANREIRSQWKNSKWDNAVYALQTFTSLLNEQDTLVVSGCNDSGDLVRITAESLTQKKLSDYIEKLRKVGQASGGTIFEEVRKLYRKLLQDIGTQTLSSNQEIWFVVITDGVWNQNSVQRYNTEKKDVFAGLQEIGSTPVGGVMPKVLYFTIGQKVDSLQDEILQSSASGIVRIEEIHAPDAARISEAMAALSDQVSGRIRFGSDRYTLSGNTLTVKTEIPMLDMVVLVQSSSKDRDYSDISAQGPSGSLKVTRMADIVSPSGALRAAMRRFSAAEILREGTYTVTLPRVPEKGDEVTILFQPALEMRNTYIHINSQSGIETRMTADEFRDDVYHGEEILTEVHLFESGTGREIRVMVKPEDVNDDGIKVLAKEIAKRIEEQMEYPGQIRVNVIRETRSTEYAK